MLIQGAELWGHGPGDLRVIDGCIAARGQLSPQPGEPVIAARGGLLLPGLHDHHIHLAALAVRDSSLWCGPPSMTNAGQLADRLQLAGTGWIRAIGYHESVMGLPTASDLDQLVAHRPLRIQHRSGRMWLLNSLALELLLTKAKPPTGLEREGGNFTGRLFDEDHWLRDTLASAPPPFADIASALGRYGITGITDMSPRNDPAMAGHFAREMSKGSLRQRCVVAGNLSLGAVSPDRWQIGPAKLHLHEAALPAFDDAVAFIASGHHQSRAVAIHCTTEVELVFALAALEAAGAMAGDRIEHASIASADNVHEMARLGLAVCVQPHFIAERGEQYLSHVETRHLPDLYRISSLAEAGIALCGGSDAPFASADPWQAIAAAVSRRTAQGMVIGGDEALSAKQALKLYLADPADLTHNRNLNIGDVADLCLLSVTWAKASLRLSADDVRATFIGGDCIYQAPA